jgi:hypothetical protein
VRGKFRHLNGNTKPLLLVRLSHDVEDVAVLAPYNSVPVEVDESRLNPDNCIFKGYLENEPESNVIITGGCPGDYTFDVSS